MMHKSKDGMQGGKFDAYEPSRRLSDAYDHKFKKKYLTLWFLVGLKEKIHAPSEVNVGFWIEM